MDTEVVIPAAGLGTRMGEFTDDSPKCLVELNDKTILEHQLELLEEFGIPRSSIHLVIGAKGECWTQDAYQQIRDLHDNIVVNFENTIRGPAFSLKLGLDETTSDSVLVIDSDIVLTSAVVESLLNTDHSGIITKVAEDRGEPGSKVVTDDRNVVSDIGKEINPDDFPWHIYGGICRVTGGELNAMRSYLETRDLADVGADTVLQHVCREGTLIDHVFDGGWINTNKPEDLVSARSLDV